MMKGIALLAVILILAAGVPTPAHAHGGAAIALGAFAAFTLLTAPLWALAYAPPPVYVAPQPVVYAPPPAVTYAPPPPPAVQRQVVYAHGRYVLLGDGVTTAYQWVWVPNPPPGPPPAPPPGAR